MVTRRGFHSAIALNVRSGPAALSLSMPAFGGKWSGLRARRQVTCEAATAVRSLRSVSVQLAALQFIGRFPRCRQLWRWQRGVLQIPASLHRGFLFTNEACTRGSDCPRPLANTLPKENSCRLQDHIHLPSCNRCLEQKLRGSTAIWAVAERFQAHRAGRSIVQDAFRGMVESTAHPPSPISRGWISDGAPAGPKAE